MAICVNDRKVYLWEPNKLFKGDKKINFKNFDGILVAHYSMFENYIWHHILVKRYGWPKIPLRQWRCTAALAASHALPRSLENAAKALNLVHQKDKVGKRIMQKMCKPRKPTKAERKDGTVFTSPLWHENPEDFDKLYAYCMEDVEVERELHNTFKNHNLTDLEQKVWIHDQMINTRGIAVDMDLVNSAIEISNKHVEDCNSKMIDLTDGYVDKASQVGRIKTWMASLGFFTDSLNKETPFKKAKRLLPPYP